ncbi:MAG: hypothetical protein H7Y13_15810 [Sphingobacteriaceae bacterium]|nr:hypothetical protein [Sphingobacteriaceae bacterium]
MSENDKIPSRLTQKESYIGKQHPENINEPESQENNPYPNQEQREGVDNEKFIINNSNSNGINPNPIESGNEPDWVDGRKQGEDYIDDATE